MGRMTWIFCFAASNPRFPCPPTHWIRTCWARVRVGSKAWRFWATMRWNPPGGKCGFGGNFCILKKWPKFIGNIRNIRNNDGLKFRSWISWSKKSKMFMKCWCWSTNISPIEIVLLHWMFRWPKLLLSKWLYCNCTVQQLPSWIYQETLGNPLVKWLCRLMFLFKC